MCTCNVNKYGICVYVHVMCILPIQALSLLSILSRVFLVCPFLLSPWPPSASSGEDYRMSDHTDTSPYLLFLSSLGFLSLQVLSLQDNKAQICALSSSPSLAVIPRLFYNLFNVFYRLCHILTRIFRNS